MSAIGILVLLSVAHADTFRGYECTQDCSGHQAGYEWAERHDITDPNDCGGRSQSFIEGCQAWAKENEDDRDDSEKIADGDCEDEDGDEECDEW